MKCARPLAGDDPQIVFALVCTADGLSIAVEGFPGNTADPATVAALVEKLKTRDGLQKLALSDFSHGIG